jgi:hypothetical protein
MSALMYIIFGWLLGELFHMTLWEWTKNKFKLDNRKVKTIFVFVSIALFIAVVGSGFYRVTSNEHVIVTSLLGEKVVKDTHGIKYSLLSSRESVSTQKQIMKFPSGTGQDGYEIITSDEKPLLVNSFLEYKIKDVRKWGIENKDSKQKLLILFASKVKNSLQKSDYNYARSNINKLEKEVKEGILDVEELYGIEIINVNLQISDTFSVRQSKSEAEKQKIESESLKESYLSEAEALRTKYDSLDDKEFIKYMEFLKAIEEGKVKLIVVPQDTITSYNIGDIE